ncbi:hypothetical protein ACM66B_004294 [Microbotryomycetes sp. NB124-2]
MSAIYSIYTSPNQRLAQDSLPTLLVTPHGRPAQVLYTYLHTNSNSENYLLTPSEAGDVVVAKLQPPNAAPGKSSSSTSSQGVVSASNSMTIRCEASRNLRWSIHNVGLQNPIYKMTVPNPQEPGEEQPLFQVSKPNPNATWWTLFYFAYAGHLIPPERIEFGRIQKNSPESGGGTRVTIAGRTEAEAAVWRTLGENNEDMVEWIVICAALAILDDEIRKEAGRNGGQMALVPPSMPIANAQKSRTPSPSNSAVGMQGYPSSPSGVPRSQPSPRSEHGEHGYPTYSSGQALPPPRQREASSSSSNSRMQQPQSTSSRQAPPPHGAGQSLFQEALPSPTARGFQLQDRPVPQSTPSSQSQQAYGQAEHAHLQRPEPTYAYENPSQRQLQQMAYPSRSYSDSPASLNGSALGAPRLNPAGSRPGSRQASVSPSYQQQQMYQQQQQQQQQYYQQQATQPQTQYEQHLAQPAPEQAPAMSQQQQAAFLQSLAAPPRSSSAKLQKDIGAKRAAAGIR